MRILCVSDIVDKYLYSSEDSLKIKPDLIISCGDLPKDYLEFLMSKYNVPLFFVQGNHDNYYYSVEGAYDYSEVKLISNSRFDFSSKYDYSKSFAGVNIDRKIVKFGDLLFLGFEGSNKYNNGIHQYTQEEMYRRVRSVYAKLLIKRFMFGRGVDIIVTHAPPYGIHDRDDIVHTGFKAFLEIIEKFRPKYLLHGHTHIYDIREKKITEYGETKIINCYGYFVLDL